MKIRTLQLFALTSFFLVRAAAADDPFVGKWKLNLAKSQFTGQIEKIADLGGKKYKFSFGSISWDVSADGVDTATPYGDTEAFTAQDANTWKFVSKVKGKEVGTAVWTLSPDGKTLTKSNSGTKPNGDTFQMTATLKRIAGTKGFAGSWQTTDAKISSPDEVDISAWDDGGLILSIPSFKLTQKLKFDGKDYAAEGPEVPEGSVTSGKRVNSHLIHTTDKSKGKVTETVDWKLSADGKTATIVEHDPGEEKPSIAVYDRM